MQIDINIKDTSEVEESEQDRKDYCATIFAVFPRLEKDIKKEMYSQLIATYSEAIGTTRAKEERDFEILRGNGIMEGMARLLEKWEVASNEYISKTTESKESFDRHEPISQI